VKRAIIMISAGFMILGFVGCGQSDSGTGATDTEQSQVDVDGGAGSDVDADTVVEDEVISTEIPPEWDNAIPVPTNGEIANVVSSFESISVTWLTPMGDTEVLTTEYATALNAAGFTEGETDAGEFYGYGQFANETHVVTFTITGVTDDTLEYTVTYEPLSDEN
jgi:hypothetical protein